MTSSLESQSQVQVPPLRPTALRKVFAYVHGKLRRWRGTWLICIDRTRASLGIRRGFHATGHRDVYFKELSPIGLTRALSKRGPGHKDYRVTFADGSKQIIRVSANRVYCDVQGAEGAQRYVRVAHLVRPGSRVLEVETRPLSTGYTADYLSRLVGPSGAVVALIADKEGAQFATNRHARPNLSLELLEGSLADHTAGEIDGAFDAVFHLGATDADVGIHGTIEELWRLVIPGGWLLVGASHRAGLSDNARQALLDWASHVGDVAVIQGDPADVLVRRPMPKER